MTAAALIRIILVDDHALFRKGLVFLLTQEPDLQVVAETDNGLQAAELAAQCPADIVLMDLDMPVMNGLQALIQIRQQQPHLPVLILTVTEEVSQLRQCLAAGANGYVLKNTDSDFLVAAIRRVVCGHQVISAEMTQLLIKQSAAPVQDNKDGLAALSQREKEVLHCLACGHSNKLIAKQLRLSENTVKVHVQNILKKLNLHSRVQAAIFANSLEADKTD